MVGLFNTVVIQLGYSSLYKLPLILARGSSDKYLPTDLKAAVQLKHYQIGQIIGPLTQLYFNSLTA